VEKDLDSMNRILPLLWLVLTSFACSGQSTDFKVPPVPEGLALADFGLDPPNPQPLDPPVAWAQVRDATQVRIFTAVVDTSDLEDLDPSLADYVATSLDAVSEPDELGWVRYEVRIEPWSTHRALLYYLEAEGEGGELLQGPEGGAPQALAVSPLPLELDFEWPAWPDLVHPLPCVSDVARVEANAAYLGGGGGLFQVIKDPVWEPLRRAVVPYGNLADLRRGIGVEIAGQAYFFPLIILLWTETSNQFIGGLQTVMTYCPLTDTALFFDPGFDPERLPKFHDFAPAGLYNSNLSVGIEGLPRGQASAFNQMMGFAITGPRKGECVRPLPSVMTTIDFWRKLHPDTKILEGDRGDDRNWIAVDNPYRNYWRDKSLRAPISEPDPPPSMEMKGTVMGIMGEGEPLAIALRQEPFVLNDRVGETPIVVFYQARTAFCLERALAGVGELTFRRSPASLNGTRLYVDDQPEPSFWTPEGVAVSGPLAGRRLAWVPSMSAFWFAWHTMYPETRFVDPIPGSSAP
jgi:hypothetical protein